MHSKILSDYLTSGDLVLFQTPTLGERERNVLAEIASLKAGPLAQYAHHQPRRWTGSMRRLAFARNIQGSNTIEGYFATLDDAAAVVVGQSPIDTSEDAQLALAGYRQAMTYILQLGNDNEFEYSTQMLRVLHFMMTGHDHTSGPGNWRPGEVFVRRAFDGAIVYEGAPADEVPTLMRELVDGLNSDMETDPIVKAAMAHLNLVMVHPFRDGNGRMARAVQSLVLARSGTLSPLFVSIEEYLGANTSDYYAALAAVGMGRWQPERDAVTWIRFMLTAHLRQALIQAQRNRQAEAVWQDLEELRSRLRLPERVLTALFDAALGLRVRNNTYRATLSEQGDEISEHSASTDLKRLVDLDLLLPVGEKRGRHYIASPAIAALASRSAQTPATPLPDPFGMHGRNLTAILAEQREFER